jgi:hypothetical protein
MEIRMAQKIKQANIFGRIGSGIGQGLAEQIPKEIERNRLASGLRQFEQEYQNMTPMQQLARLSSIPGIPNQTIQSFSELARRQNLANAYGRSGGGVPGLQEGGSGNLVSIGGNDPSQQINQQLNQQLSEQPPMMNQRSSQTGPVPSSEYSPQQIETTNPLAEELQPRTQWSPEKRNARVSEYISMGFTPEESRQLASDDEGRYLSEPASYRERRDYLKDVKKNLKQDLKSSIEEKLQKSGESAFQDIEGDHLNDLMRGASRDLRMKPRATEEDVINDWSNRALDYAKSKAQFKKDAAVTGIEGFFKPELYDNLKSYSQDFSKAGRSEEYYNLLKSQYGMSPQGAASIAYPVRKPIQDFLQKERNQFGKELRSKGRAASDEQISNFVRGLATRIGEVIKPEDSLLAIAAQFQKDYPGFYQHQREFFDQLREDAEDLGLTARQRREIPQGVPGWVSPWGDLMILPWFRKGK